MRVDVDFRRFLLQNLPEPVGTDAAEESSHLLGFLDHPLGKRKHKQQLQ